MTQKKQSGYGQESWFKQKIVSEGYENVGAYYGYGINGYQIFRHHFLIELLKQEIKDDIPLSVLDVGCGVGDFVSLVKRNFATKRLVGVDFVEPVVITAAQRFPEIEFGRDSLPKLETVSGKFDLIIASEVLYYLSEPEQHYAMERFDELLYDGGFVLISSTLASNAFPSA